MTVDKEIGRSPERTQTQEFVLNRLEDAYVAIPKFDLNRPNAGADGLEEQRQTRLNFLEECSACKHNLHPEDRHSFDEFEATARDESYQLRQALNEKK